MNCGPRHYSEHSERIQIRGLVQGVGLRPTIWRQAQQLGINGEVRNDGSGVVIIAQSSRDAIDTLVRQLQGELPPLARVDQVERQAVTLSPRYEDFSITHSIADSVSTGLVADAATCDACLADILDNRNRRAGYAFTNCTHCGPRFSITRGIPYDRANTSMSAFPLCERCEKEYQSPQSRRFHAQPNACEDCGPSLQLVDSGGTEVAGKCLETSADLIRQGNIIAIKGSGGFQLACSATDTHAVAILRQRKHRPHRPLALMASSIGQIMTYCEVSGVEKTLLQSPAAPIVLLQRRRKQDPSADSLSEAIASGSPRLGFMLPNNPLQHLLMRQLNAPIVLTSGNRAGQPQCIDDRQALRDLGEIADYFLMHDRKVLNRVDDSVMRVERGLTHLYRRARGYAPESILLAPDLQAPLPVLACGGEVKNTFCILEKNRATLSAHIGDLHSARANDDFSQNLALYRRLFGFEPGCIAVDLHPQYHASTYGRKLASELGLPLIEVQHHHAHIAACLADNGWSYQQGPVIGVALDGLGYGDDDSFWGGELMLADYCRYERRARLEPVPMPGGNAAMMEPWRNTYAQLQQHFNWAELAKTYAGSALFQMLEQRPLPTLDSMIAAKLNSPLSSSCGRLFDAVAAALGLCPERISYEGQAAIALENCLDPAFASKFEGYEFELGNADVFDISPRSMWQNLLQDMADDQPAGDISARFHLGLAAAIIEASCRISQSSGIQTVALSGGVFQNLSLFELCRQGLEARGMQVLFHRQVPANDGGLSLGQAAIAAARIKYGEL